MISRWRAGVDATQAERRAKALRIRLEALEEQRGIAARAIAEDPTSFALQLTLQSFKDRQPVLERELTTILQAREREVISVTLDGPRYKRHSADFLSLSDVLKRLQKLYTSILQALTEGPTHFGPVSAGVQALSRLRLAEVFPSSFGMSVEVETLPDMFGHSKSVAALQALFELLGAPAKANNLLDSIGDIGPRAGSHYRSLINALVKSETTATVMWTDPVGNGFDWSAEPQTLADIGATLASIQTEVSDSRTAAGMLLGASLLRNRFEFLTDEPAEILMGRIAEDARDNVRINFGRHCTIVYQETTVTSRVSDAVRSLIVLTDVKSDENGPGSAAPAPAASAIS